MLSPLPVVALLAAASLGACGGSGVEVSEAAEIPTTANKSVQSAEDVAEELAEPILRASQDGLIVRVLKPGRGTRARLGDRILLHYRGRVAESDEEFLSTWKQGIPAELTLGQKGLIRGLERALLGIRPGTRAEVDVPAALAYGEAGLGAIPPNSDLRFELDIVSIRGTSDGRGSVRASR